MAETPRHEDKNTFVDIELAQRSDTAGPRQDRTNSWFFEARQVDAGSGSLTNVRGPSRSLMINVKGFSAGKMFHVREYSRGWRLRKRKTAPDNNLGWLFFKTQPKFHVFVPSQSEPTMARHRCLVWLSPFCLAWVCVRLGVDHPQETRIPTHPHGS